MRRKNSSRKAVEKYKDIQETEVRAHWTWPKEKWKLRRLVVSYRKSVEGSAQNEQSPHSAFVIYYFQTVLTA